MSDQAQAASWSDLLSGRNGLRSLVFAGGVALHAINVFIVATILPSVVADIGGLEYYAWNMALFVAASILGSALVPKLADKVGLRQGFLVAIFIFVIGTIVRSEEHTSELQSRGHLVCRLLREIKKTNECTSEAA